MAVRAIISCTRILSAARSICVAPAFICTALNQPIRESCARLSASFTSDLLTRADSAFLAWRAQMQITGTACSIRP
ncbi:MAG: hypothetical protein K2Q27_03355 [Novosphingobium sp.]|nr:hypothetical protein [Novosphingobium sp.]